MNRILQYDQIDFSPTKITQRDDELFGPVTVFHDVVIAREIVHQYEDGMAYKPAKELADAAWTAEGRWVVIGSHPSTAIVASRDDIGGRTVNIRSTKSLIDPKTERPNNRGILADLEVFDSRVDPIILNEMKAGIRTDVSIGFFFDQDAVSGTIDEEGHPLNGIAYDYVQRNITIDHTAAALGTGSGRCPMPYCGIGADAFKRLVTGDPLDKCVAAVMRENPDYSRERAEAICYSQEQKSKDFKLTDGNNLSMKQTIEEAKVYLRDILSKLDSIEFTEDDLVEEEYQGNATSMTKSERARMFFVISEDDWAALSEAEKLDRISRLPPEKVRAGGEELSDRDAVDEDCEDCDEDEELDEEESEPEVVETDETPEPMEENVEAKPRDVLKDDKRIWDDFEEIVR